MHRWAAVLFFMFTTSTIAHAKGGAQLVVVVAEAEADVVQDIRRTGEAVALTQRWRISTPSSKAQSVLYACVTKRKPKVTCIQNALGPIEADVILVFSATSSTTNDGEPQVRIDGRLVERETGKIAGTTQRFCLRCYGTQRLIALARNLATELVRARAASLAPYTKLRIIATPDDAMVTIDGLEAGPAGTAYHVPPGRVAFTLTRKGYKTAKRVVTVKANEELVLRIPLVRLGDDKRNNVPHSRRSLLPWTLGGLGIASLTLGVTWLIQHEALVSDGRNSSTVRDVKTRGVVSTGLGVALLGTATYLWLRGRSRTHNVSLWPTQGGALVAWGRRF